MDIAKYIDHTLLKPDATREQIALICDEAKQYSFASVCVNPVWVDFCSGLLKNTEVKVCAVVGNRNGYVGVGMGKSKETVPARDKAKRTARINLIRIRRGCGSWEAGATEPNSIPFAVEGRCGSVRVKLMPAPQGKGLCIEKECAKILALAGIKDIWSKTKGQTGTKPNLIFALVDALKKLTEVKVQPQHVGKLAVVEGKMKQDQDTEEKIEPVMVA